MKQRQWLCLMLVLTCTRITAAATAPVAVSPGRVDVLAAEESRCPTFSWSTVEGAEGYEIAVYSMEAGRESGEPNLNRRFKGRISSWTPSLAGCLERGRQYAWVVRALGRSTANDWSQPNLFRVTAGPSQKDFAEALLVVRQYLEEEAIGRDEPSPATSRVASDRTRGAFPVPSTPELGTVPGTPSDSSSPQDETSAAAASAFGVAALTVEGEVRTVDASSSPRLWGHGRPGTEVYLEKDSDPASLCRNGNVNFGLSRMSVTWDAAAGACPAGTWVCTEEERGAAACDTLRPDSGLDALTCDGTGLNWTPNDHWGWLADGERVGGRATPESGGILVTSPCASAPVWCCSE